MQLSTCFVSQSRHGTSTLSDVRRKRPVYRVSSPRHPARLVEPKAATHNEPPNHDKVEWLKSVLSERGMDKQLAQQVMKMWSLTGTNDAELLRQSLVSRSLTSLASNLLQLTIDAGAAFAAFYTSSAVVAAEPEGALSGVAHWSMILLGSYLSVGVLMDGFSLAVLVSLVYFYSTSSESVMEAVRELAGESPISVVDKTRTALSMGRVMAALDKLKDILQEDADKLTGDESLLHHLQSYSVLQTARENSGFDAAQYGLSDTEASKIALEFDKYDADNDGRLDLDDIRKLCAGCDLSGDDVQAALDVLDFQHQGYVDFQEFVIWWTSKARPPELGSSRRDAAAP